MAGDQTQRSITPPIIRGRRPEPHEKEFLEYTGYESGANEEAAKKVPGRHAEPWFNVLDSAEPSTQPGFEEIKRRPELRKFLRGTVLDVGAGTCWLTAGLSKLPEVDHVYALDLSEAFLTTTGVRIMETLGGDLSKVTLVASDFNHMPLADASIDVAMLFAAIHHSLSPIKTLMEIRRVLRPGGVLLMFECPKAIVRIRSARRRSVVLSDQVTEICYTRGEFEYLLQCAKFFDFAVHPMDVLTRGTLRLGIRRMLRVIGLEDVIISPPPYLFVAARN